MKKHNTLYLGISLMGALLAACESDANLQDVPTKGGILKIVAPTLTSEATGTQQLPETVDIYEFADGQFQRSQSVNPTDDNIEVAVSSDAKVYCVSGATVDGLTSSTTLEQFLSATIASPEGANGAPMFYAGVAEPSGDEALTLELRRGVARIDLACEDSRIVIKEVIVDNAPAASLILPCETTLQDFSIVTYSLKLADDFAGRLEEAFTIFESAKPVTVRVKGTFDGDIMNFSTTIPVIGRNKIYTLNVSGGTDVTADIKIADWQEGDKGEGYLALGETAINLEASVIPDGVKVDTAENTVTFPADGVKDMKLSFVTATPLSLGTVLGNTEGISITALDPVAVEGGYTSSFRINVSAQPKCANSYGITAFFNGRETFFLNMEVEASPYQIPTVHIGGHDWMCFNAISDNLDEQFYLNGDTTVEDMYANNFVECVGNYFQYGKPNPFSPWAGSDPNMFADQTRDVPWRSAGKMPMPKGFHVATTKEWQDLIPDNTTIPASYKSPTGDSIKVALVTLDGTLDNSPSQTTNAQNYKKRYLLFESVTSGAKLYLPFAGIKEAKNVEIPTQAKFRFDTRSAYWMAEERYILLMDFKTLDSGDGVNLVRNRWNADGFMMVRGVKD